MLVILLNCVTLGMFHPCEDINCDSERCKILQVRLIFGCNMDSEEAEMMQSLLDV